MTYDEGLLNREQQKIEDCYREIGRRYCAAHRDDYDADYSGLMKTLRESEKAIADHKAEVLLANGLMLCPNCGEQIYYKSIFCNFCGIRVVAEKTEEAPVEEPAEETAEEPVEEQAEEPVEETAAEEQEEGSEEISEEAAAPAGEPEVDEPQEEPAETAPLGGKIICANCGAELDDDCFFCVECGTPVPRPKTEAPAATAARRFCVECGYQVDDPEAMFCNNCGARLSGETASPLKKCPRCGFTTDNPEVNFCIECGARMVTG